MSSTPAPRSSALSLFRHRPFFLYFWARVLSSFSQQISAVAVGWQVYELTGSAFQLGMVGLVQFLPTALLVFVGGHAADRYDRRRVVQWCQATKGFAAVYLAWGSFAGSITVTEIFVAVAVFGVAQAFESPAGSALLPGVVPEGQVQRGTTVASGAFQVASISGPALGGIFYALSPGLPYAVMACFWLVGAVFSGLIQLERAVSGREPPTFKALFAGIDFVRRNPAILGTISLDLFAVLLGGATALLPVYAKDILMTGPWGLGVLRAAPAVGALLTAMYLAHHPLQRRVGLRMFQSVIVFGLATIVFGVSAWLPLSVVALALMGAADQVSVVIRISLVQLQTPDEMRGRVGAVNFLFINASNQLGEFESGLVAAWLGAVPAVIVGGVGTVLVALLWMRLFPTLRHVEKLE